MSEQTAAAARLDTDPGRHRSGRTGATCPRCLTVHCGSDVVAVGRFDPKGVHGYRPRDGGELRATRGEAMDDVCAARVAARNEPNRAQHRPAPHPVAPKHEAVTDTPPPAFPAAAVETAAREKAWADLLTQVRLSLEVWRIDADVRAGCEPVLHWLRRLAADLTARAAPDPP